MPAAELNRLREQLRLIFEHFANPEQFAALIVELCEEYHDPSFRGQSGEYSPLTPSLRLPPMVTRQLELSLARAAHEQPMHAIPAARVLWQLPWLETKQYASLLVGETHLRYADEILEVLREWLQPGTERRVLQAVFERATQRLRAEGAEALLRTYANWVNDMDVARRQLGLQGFLSLARDQGFINLPPIYLAITNLVRAHPPALSSDLYQLLAVLAERSPVETAFFLRQVLGSPVSRDTPRLVRRLFPYFSPEQQSQLRAVMDGR